MPTLTVHYITLVPDVMDNNSQRSSLTDCTCFLSVSLSYSKTRFRYSPAYAFRSLPFLFIPSIVPTSLVIGRSVRDVRHLMYSCGLCRRYVTIVLQFPSRVNSVTLQLRICVLRCHIFNKLEVGLH